MAKVGAVEEGRRNQKIVEKRRRGKSRVREREKKFGRNEGK